MSYAWARVYHQHATTHAWHAVHLRTMHVSHANQTVACLYHSLVCVTVDRIWTKIKTGIVLKQIFSIIKLKQLYGSLLHSLYFLHSLWCLLEEWDIILLNLFRIFRNLLLLSLLIFIFHRSLIFSILCCIGLIWVRILFRLWLLDHYLALIRIMVLLVLMDLIFMENTSFCIKLLTFFLISLHGWLLH